MKPSTTSPSAPRAARALGTGLLCAASLLASACLAAGDEPQCGQAPPLPITGFVVTTITGDNATDMDIDFCFLRKSAADYECQEIDSSGDNFEEWQTDVFELSVEPIEVGDLESFKIRNTGGGWFESSWDMAGVKVEAVLMSGEVVLLFEDLDIDTNLERGEGCQLTGCSY